MSATNAPVNPQGQPPAESTSGTVQTVSGEFAIGSQNSVGYIAPTKQTVQTGSAQIQTQQTKTAETVQPTQTKDERHAAQKITELSERRISYAKLAVEADKDAIYQIAKEEPDLAEKLLKEYDYGTESVEELLAKAEHPNLKEDELKKRVEDDSRIKELEAKVLEESIKRLKKDHPDLKDELEQEFRSMYSNPALKQYSEDTKLNLARAATEQPSQQPETQVVLDLLKQQEGTTTSPKGGETIEKKNRIPPDKARLYRSAGVTEETMDLYLPPDIDQVIERAFNAAAESE